MKAIQVNPGDKYGDLTVIREAAAESTGKRQILCQCDCGNKEL